MSTIRFVAFALCGLVLSGCAGSARQEPTSLEIQAFQSREFEATKGEVFGSVMSVFQDLGYIIESADVETGFITSASASQNKTNFWQALNYVSSSGQTKATAFVEPLASGRVRARLNFVDTENKSGRFGQAMSEDTPIMDPAVYKAAFDKIEEALFIRQSME